MLVDLIPISSLHKSSTSAELVAHRIHSLHDEIKRRIDVHNESYNKTATDTYHLQVEFKIGNYVIIRLGPEQSPQGTTKKLLARSSKGSFKILKRLGPNSCVETATGHGD